MKVFGTIVLTLACSVAPALAGKVYVNYHASAKEELVLDTSN